MPLSMVFPAFMALLFLLSLPFIRGAERRFVLVALAIIGGLSLLAFGSFQTATGTGSSGSERSGLETALILLFIVIATLAAALEAVREGLRDAFGAFGPLVGLLLLVMLGAGGLWLAGLHRRASRKPPAPDDGE